MSSFLILCQMIRVLYRHFGFSIFVRTYIRADVHLIAVHLDDRVVDLDPFLCSCAR